MKKRTLAYLLQAPVLVLFGIVVLGSFYIKLFNPALLPRPISWFTPITLLIFLVIYFYGRYLEKKHQHEYY